MTMQIIEITEVHPEDVRASYVVGCIFCINDNTQIHPTSNSEIGKQGFLFMTKLEAIGADNLCGEAGETRTHYAVKYKVLFGVKEK